MDLKNLPKNTRLIIYSFIGAFAISFLIGVMAKNPIGIIFRRAFVCSILFGGLIYIGDYLLRKYIPEWETITSGQSIGNEKVNETEVGEVVGYKLEDEKGVAQHIKVQEPDEVVGEGKKEQDIEIEKMPTTPEADEEDQKEGLPSLERLLEDERTVPDVEAEKAPLKDDKRIKGDYINIGNIRIPNEPEVIAKAIKKVMSEDER